jgi:hypothetical protein
MPFDKQDSELSDPGMDVERASNSLPAPLPAVEEKTPRAPATVCFVLPSRLIHLNKFCLSEHRQATG